MAILSRLEKSFKRNGVFSILYCLWLMYYYMMKPELHNLEIITCLKIIELCQRIVRLWIPDG